MRRIFQFSGFKLALIIAVLFSLLFELKKETWDFLEELEFSVLDIKFRNRGSRPVSGNVVIAAVDEKSLVELGLWPWPRKTWGQFLDELSRSYQPRVVSFDIVFAEPDKNVGIKLVQDLKGFAEKFTTLGLQDKIASLQKEKNELSSQLKSLHPEDDQRVDIQEEILQLDTKIEMANKQISQLNLTYGALTKEGDKLWKSLVDIEKSTDNDLIFSQSLKRTKFPVNLGYFFFTSRHMLKDLEAADFLAGIPLIDPVKIPARLGEGVDPERYFISPVGLRTNIPMLSRSTKHFGFFNFKADPDKIFRRIHLVYYFDEKYYPSLALETLKGYYGEPLGLQVGTSKVREEEAREVKIMVGEKDVPVDDHSGFLLNYYGPKGTIPTYSIIDIIAGKIPKEKLQDKVIFIGPTAVGIYDLRPSPYESDYPGVELHATMVENVLNEDFLTRPSYVEAIEFLTIILLGIILGWLLNRVKLTYGLICTMVLSVLMVYLDKVLFFDRGLWMQIVMPIMEMWIIFIGIAVYRYFTEEKDKLKIKKAFQFYVTKSVVDEMLKDASKLQLGGQKEELTVLFSDIRGFTSISENLAAEQLAYLINSYLTPMTNIVFKYNGTLDKYMGDAIMAIFGAPIHYQYHAVQACHAALEMMDELNVLCPQWVEKGFPPINIGIGINTGFMSVGNMGSDIRFDYTVMGDNVNLGSRLEGINKQYKTNIILSEYTYLAVKDRKLFNIREMDSVRVKGKQEPVVIYELVSRGKPKQWALDLIATFEAGLAAYKKQEWDKGLVYFQNALKIKQEDFASQLYLERCQTYMQNPPGQNWDGVFTMTSK